MDAFPAPSRRRRSNRRVAIVLIALCASFGLVACSDNASGGDAAFEGLNSGQRVYDRTGNSLDPSQTADIERRLEALKSDTGADVIAYVRDSTRTPMTRWIRSKTCSRDGCPRQASTRTPRARF
ncbi:hypothetical protein [Rhodococcoides fascians]|uniref:hypothetical protein n=1 Tax=Rhodococcoides fascians TaxID=1828 RepID=UPI00050C7998|nr:hypothetical protein [Rhodococcus fascians]